VTVVPSILFQTQKNPLISVIQEMCIKRLLKIHNPLPFLQLYYRTVKIQQESCKKSQTSRVVDIYKYFSLIIRTGTHMEAANFVTSSPTVFMTL
jgi:hypothetical protein